MQPRPAHGHAYVLAQGDHQPQVVLGEAHPARALDVEEADHLPLVKQGDADLRGDPLYRPEKLRVRGHVFEQNGLTGADRATRDAVGHGDAVENAVVPDLMLQHEFVAFQQVGAHLRVPVRLGDGLDHLPENVGQFHLLRQGRAHLVQEGELP